MWLQEVLSWNMYSLKYLYTYFQISLVYIQARGYVTTLECGDTTSLFYNKNGKVLCSSLSSSVVSDCFNMKWQSIEIAEKYSARVLSSSVVSDCFNMKWQSLEVALQGRIQDFKLWGGEHLKKLRRAEGGANIFGVFRVKNHDFMPKNHIFSNFWEGCWVRPLPGSAPALTNVHG